MAEMKTWHINTDLIQQADWSKEVAPSVLERMNLGVRVKATRSVPKHLVVITSPAAQAHDPPRVAVLDLRTGKIHQGPPDEEHKWPK